MTTKQTTANSTELTGYTKTGREYVIVFSYGRPIAARFNGNYFVNLQTWKFSKTTSKHLYTGISSIKQLEKIIDKGEQHPALTYAVNDEQLSNMVAEEMSK